MHFIFYFSVCSFARFYNSLKKAYTTFKVCSFMQKLENSIWKKFKLLKTYKTKLHK